MTVPFQKVNAYFALKWRAIFLVNQDNRFSYCLFFTEAMACSYRKQHSLSLFWSHQYSRSKINTAGLESKATMLQVAPPWWKLPSPYTKDSFQICGLLPGMKSFEVFIITTWNFTHQWSGRQQRMLNHLYSCLPFCQPQVWIDNLTVQSILL